MPIDLTKLSDEELVALQKGDLSKLSDDTLYSLASKEVPVEKPIEEDYMKFNARVADKMAKGIPLTPEEEARSREEITTGAVAGLNVPAGIVGKPVDMLADFLKGRADKVMQSAVGLRNYIPGVGKELIESGIWGTRGGMKKGIEEAAEKSYERSGDIVKNIRGDIDYSPIAQKMAEAGGKEFAVGGLPATGMGGKLEKAERLAKEVEKRGSVSPQSAFEYLKKAGKEAYQSEKELPGLERKKMYAPIYRAEERATREAIKQMAEEQGIPTLGQEFAKQSKYITALKPLEKPEGLRPQLGDFLFTGGGGLLGATVGQDPTSSAGGAGLAAALAMGARSPLGRSLRAKGGYSLGKSLPVLSEAIIRSQVPQKLERSEGEDF